jgi:diadenosine tetraphosphate (Ap4A) HIT family hydrolase
MLTLPPFTLHPRLAADTLLLGHLPLCACLLMNDMHYPWLILVPQRENLREIFELSPADQQQLIRESSWVSERLSTHFKADKINIGALGNMVAQLHIHHIARYENDAAWPGPVWGKHPTQPYSADNLLIMQKRLHEAFSDNDAGTVTMDFVWAK